MVTEDSGYSYYASGLTLIPNMYQYIRFWKGNDLIPSSAINYNQPILTAEDNNDVFEDNGMGDEWLLVIVPLSTIRIIPIDDPQDQYEYSTECVVEPINVVIDGTEYPCTSYNGWGSWTFDPSEAGISQGDILCPGTAYQVKVFNTYADMYAITDPDGGTEEHVGSAFTPSYCVDDGYMIDFTNDYYHYPSFTVSSFNVPKTNCMNHIYFNQSDTWIDIMDEGGYVDLQAAGYSVGPGDYIGIFTNAGNMICECDNTITVYDGDGNYLGLFDMYDYPYGWENTTTDIFTAVELNGCTMTLHKLEGGRWLYVNGDITATEVEDSCEFSTSCNLRAGDTVDICDDNGTTNPYITTVVLNGQDMQQGLPYTLPSVPPGRRYSSIQICNGELQIND